MKRVLALVFVLIFLVGCVQVDERAPVLDSPNNIFCEQDSDCVPSECCHPTGAVNKDYAPDCAAVMCSASCEPNTLDCGQGEIKCVDNECTAVIG